MKPFISIIIPVYNSESFLEKCIASIQNQSFSDWELILVNNGSTDKSLNICRNYSNIDYRIKAYNNKELGAGNARNYGIRKAIAEYIMFVDADDYLINGCLEIIVDKAKATESDLIVCNYLDFKEVNGKDVVIKNSRMSLADSDDKKVIYSYYMYLFENFLIKASWSKLYKKKIIIENNIIFPNIKRCEDIFFNIEFYFLIHSISFIKSNCYAYRSEGMLYQKQKIPQNYFKIWVNIKVEIESKLKEKNVITLSFYEYFDAVLMEYLYTLFIALFFTKNPWNLTKNEIKSFVFNLLNDDNVTQLIKKKYVKRRIVFFKFVLKVKKFWLIKLLCSLHVFLLKKINDNVLTSLKERFR